MVKRERETKKRESAIKLTMMKMVMKMNPNRVFSAATLRLTRFFVTEHAEAPVMGGRISGVRGDSLYKRLSALGYNGGTVEDTRNKYVGDDNLATKLELDSCVKGLRKYGQYPLALAVYLSPCLYTYIHTYNLIKMITMLKIRTGEPNHCALFLCVIVYSVFIRFSDSHLNVSLCLCQLSMHYLSRHVFKLKRDP